MKILKPHPNGHSHFDHRAGQMMSALIDCAGGNPDVEVKLHAWIRKYIRETGTSFSVSKLIRMTNAMMEDSIAHLSVQTGRQLIDSLLDNSAIVEESNPKIIESGIEVGPQDWAHIERRFRISMCVVDLK